MTSTVVVLPSARGITAKLSLNVAIPDPNQSAPVCESKTHAQGVMCGVAVNV